MQIAGLLLATLVTLGIVPVVYVLFVENLENHPLGTPASRAAGTIADSQE